MNHFTSYRTRKAWVVLTLLVSFWGGACTENYQSTIDFGDKTLVNDFSELAKAINDLSRSLTERMESLNKMLEDNLVAIKVAVNEQTGAITTQTTTLQEGLTTLNTTLVEQFTALKTSVDDNGDNIVTALNDQGELIALHIDQQGELIATQLVTTTDELVTALESQTATLEEKLENIHTKIDALNTAIATGLVNVQGSVATVADNIATMDQNVQAKIQAVADKVNDLVSGMTTLQTTLDTELSQLKISVDGVKTEIINLTSSQASQLQALQQEMQTQGGSIQAAITSEGTLIINAINGLGTTVSTQLGAISTAIGNQTTTLKQAIDDQTGVLGEKLEQLHVDLQLILAYSEGIQLVGTPDANGQYEAILVTTTVWEQASNTSAIMTLLNGILKPLEAPTPSTTQYCDPSTDTFNHNETDRHRHAIWTRTSNSDLLTATTGTVSEHDVTLFTVRRLYETSNFTVAIDTPNCSHDYIYCVWVSDANGETHNEPSTTLPSTVSVTFTNYKDGVYCATPQAKVYCSRTNTRS